MDAETRLVADTMVEAIITRCGCPDEQTGRDRHGAAGLPCPNPKAVEDRGEIAREHFEGADAVEKYVAWSESTGIRIPHVEEKLKKQGGK